MINRKIGGGTGPISYWMGDRDYYPRSDPRRAEHVRRIDARERIDRRIAASAGDGSYSATVERRDVT